MSSTDFQLAQQRIAARKRQRDAHIQRQLHGSSDPSVDALPLPLAGAGRVARSSWARIRGREGTRPAFRVGQVDAELLDEELLELLKGQVGEALKYFNVWSIYTSLIWPCKC